MDRNPRTLGAVAVVIAAVAAQLLSALQALGGDDIYVLENLRSAAWSRRLFAFNLDRPGPGYMPWWTGMPLQRRFIRVPASALLWLESELFGFRAFPYHLVTLALLAGSCLLLFTLLSKRAPVLTAAAVSVLPALHPAVRPLGEVLLALRLDSVAYVCKALGLFDPTAPTIYWLHQRVGEPLTIAIAAGLLAAAVWLIRGSRLGITGVVGFALFLAPPLLTRATVSVVNMPTLRQLYLPVLMGAPPLMVALAGAKLRLRVAVPMVAWAAVLAVESEIAGATLEIDRDRRLVTRSTERILAGVPGDSTVVAVGTYLCGFAPSLVWAGPSLLGIPSRSDDPDPQLTAVDDRTLIARSEVGFQIRTEAEVPTREPGEGRGPVWIPLQPAELAARGSQRIAGAMVAIEALHGDRITALRYRFDRPLAEVVFIRFRGCSNPERMVLEPAR